jgi:hypothetical protein
MFFKRMAEPWLKGNTSMSKKDGVAVGLRPLRDELALLNMENGQ